MADRMAGEGYLDAGYEFVHIDDCWMDWARDGQGRLLANHTRFPSGIAALADYVCFGRARKYEHVCKCQSHC